MSTVKDWDGRWHKAYVFMKHVILEQREGKYGHPEDDAQSRAGSRDVDRGSNMQKSDSLPSRSERRGRGLSWYLITKSLARLLASAKADSNTISKNKGALHWFSEAGAICPTTSEILWQSPLPELWCWIMAQEVYFLKAPKTYWSRSFWGHSDFWVKSVANSLSDQLWNTVLNSWVMAKQTFVRSQ